MSRPIRIAYPGAWYHVMNRGRRAENIYLDKLDYKAFAELLQEISEAWHIWIAAYCLMPNHYHMLVQTPDGNISRAMRHINGVYTQRFNRRHRLDGQLFRGRYKSILVNGDSYLLQLVRYIHRNPLKAGMVRKKWPSLLGPQEFIDWVKSTYKDIKGSDDMPQIRELYPDTDKIISIVSANYDVASKELFTSKRGTFNEPRCVAIYLIRRLRRDSLKETGTVFNLEKNSSVSSVIERMKTRIQNSRKIKMRIQKIEDEVRKS